MSRILRLLLAITVLAALTAADSCVRSDRPPQDRIVNPQRARTAQIHATSAGPYTILVIAHQLDKAGTDRTGPEHIAGGDYRQTLVYTSGLRIEILVQARGHPADVVECSITDGLRRDYQRAHGEVLCKLVTSQ